MTYHHLKCEYPYYGDVYNGNKTFEIRFNDRDYKVGDVLILHELDTFGTRTGRWIECDVVYILKEDKSRFLPDGHVCMAIKKRHWKTHV